jgi:hypothetical protein
MIRAKPKDLHQRRERGGTLFDIRKDESFRKCEAATLRRWLDVDVYILTTTQTVWEMNVSNIVGVA